VVNKKNAFWQALIAAVLIFDLGLMLGVYMENSRTGFIESSLLNSEINSVDQQLLQQINSNFDIDCKLAEAKLIKFADQIYEEAQTLEKYDESTDLTTTLKTLHKRYDLLRTLLWIQSTELKKTCNSSYNIIVYIYQYTDATVETRSEQSAFSRYLSDLKNEYGSKIILIPIAGDTGLDSLNLAVESYNIKNYPGVILNNKQVIRNLEDLSTLKNIIKNSQFSIPLTLP